MGRPARITEPGVVYHLLNRRVLRLKMFRKDRDYEAFGEERCHPLASRSSSKKAPWRILPFSRAGFANSPKGRAWLAVRIPVFARLAIVRRGHVPVTHQDQGSGTIREDPFRAPGAAAPQKTVGTRSRPLAGPSSVDDGRTGSWLAVEKPRQPLSGSRPRRTPSAKPAPQAAAAGPGANRRISTAPRLLIGERKRRLNQELWLEARHLSELAAPVLRP